MDRIEKTALSIAAAGHVLLFGILSLGLLRESPPVPAPRPPINVSLVDKVALEATAPQAATPPAESKAPDLGKPQETTALPPAPPAPEQMKPAPQPKLPPAKPEPKPAPVRAPVPRVVPKPVQMPPPPPKKLAEAKPAKVKSALLRPAATTLKTTRTNAQGNGSASGARRQARGSALGDIMKGIGTQATKSESQTPQAATMSAQAAMDIGSKIKQLVQPCASQQRFIAPGVQRIIVSIRLAINRDGSLTVDPRVIAHAGVDDENRRYVEQVDRLSIAAFKCAAPLRGLPQELYDVPNGWSAFTLRFQLP